MIAFELTLRNNSERTLFHLRRQTLQRCCTSTVCGESGIKNEWSLLYSWTPWGEQGPQLPWLLKLDILLLDFAEKYFPHSFELFRSWWNEISPQLPPLEKSTIVPPEKIHPMLMFVSFKCLWEDPFLAILLLAARHFQTTVRRAIGDF